MSRRGAVAALLAATLFWAGNYVVGGAAVQVIDPVDLTALRWVIALVPLVVLAHVVERPDWRSAARAWPRLLPSAVLGMLAYNLLLYAALQHTDAAAAALVNAFNPALITVAAAVFLRHRLTAASAGGVFLALAGVLWVLSDGHPGVLLATGLGTGDTLMLGAITAWTGYTLVGRRTADVPPITATAVQVAIAVVLMAPLLLVRLATGAVHVPADTGSLWALVYVGLLPSVASYVLWNHALRTVPPALAGVFLNMITVFAVAITVALGRSVTAAELIGGLVVIAGVLLTSSESVRRASARHRLAGQP